MLELLNKALRVDGQVEIYCIQVKIWSENSGLLELINYRTLSNDFIFFNYTQHISILEKLKFPVTTIPLPTPKIS